MTQLTRTLNGIPWFLSAPAVVVLAVAGAVFFQVLLGPYFERTFLDEVDPLARQESPVEASESEQRAPAVDAVPSEGADVGGPGASGAPVAGVLARGELRDGEPGHNGEGTVEIIRTAEGELVLRFEDFSVTNGPDLFVLLSEDPDGYSNDNVNLGGLKATDGNINYEIPPGTDVARYQSAVIWCRSFDVTFAVATLEVVQ